MLKTDYLMKRILRTIFFPLFFISARSLYLFRGLHKLMIAFGNYFYTEWKRNEFRQCSSIFNGGGIIMPHIQVIGGKHITIGDKTYIGKGSILSARDKNGKQVFTPFISIGNGCGLGEYTHITAIDKILIGDGVLLGNLLLLQIMLTEVVIILKIKCHCHHLKDPFFQKAQWL